MDPRVFTSSLCIREPCRMQIEQKENSLRHPTVLRTNVPGGMLTQLHCACIPPDRYSLSTFRMPSRRCLLVKKNDHFVMHIGSIRHGCFKWGCARSSGFVSPIRGQMLAAAREPKRRKKRCSVFSAEKHKRFPIKND